MPHAPQLVGPGLTATAIRPDPAVPVTGSGRTAPAIGPGPVLRLWEAADGALIVGAEGCAEPARLADLADLAGWLEGYLRVRDLLGRLVALDRVLVAFSGGADSAFLLALAVEALGPGRVTAATAVSASLPAAELAAARAFATGLGVEYLTPPTREMDRAGYRANRANRCYFCKSELLDTLLPLADARGAWIATGTNADDVLDRFRPGIRAASERGAVTPLADAGLTKEQVRAASRWRGLPTWDKPAAACLSSRVAYGIAITPARLARVEQAESRLREALPAAGVPVRNLRVRDLGDRARVEVDADLLPALDLELVARLVASCGFAAVEIDRQGFRSGALNEGMTPEPTGAGAAGGGARKSGGQIGPNAAGPTAPCPAPPERPPRAG